MDLKGILTQVAEGTMSVEEAERRIRRGGGPRPQRNGPDALRLVGLIFLGIGSLFAAVGIGMGLWTYAAAGDAVTEGTVVRLVGGGRSTKPVVQYEVGGQTFEVTSSVGTSPPAYAIGEKVPILYPHDRPGEGMIDSFVERRLFPLIFGGGGSLFALIGVGLALAGRSKRRPTQEDR